MPSAGSSLQTVLFRKAAVPQGTDLVETGEDAKLAISRLSDEVEQGRRLAVIEDLDSRLKDHFGDKLLIHRSLTRQLVSFQANKREPAVRWYKYKEAFSASLTDFLFSRYDIRSGAILDPFAGAGTGLFVAADAGLDADGIELLPIGQEIIETRSLIRHFKPAHFQELKRWIEPRAWNGHTGARNLPELRITAGAYPAHTVQQIEKYTSAIENEQPSVRRVLRFALLCVLENISFTRKDGQYLRWDYRSGRRQGARRFDKGKIVEFDAAISAKIAEIVSDSSPASSPVELFPNEGHHGSVKLIAGSCLDILPKLAANRYDALLTSPPYCNRYDYTRTYALELALLGTDTETMSSLRQQMLSCTVENREKDLVRINPAWAAAIDDANRQELLQQILSYLDWCRDVSILNNNGIARMVRGYFYEMACIIYECRRVLKPGAPLIMVNDNVRYAGASISVDLVLSALAERLGFNVENVLVLPNGKGNSSQQMGKHGREQLRKCVYVWRKKPCRTSGI